MILSEVRDYLAEHKRVPLMDMAYRFEMDPEALRGMLDVLERNGRIKKLPLDQACSDGCSKCAPQANLVYEWVGRSKN